MKGHWSAKGIFNDSAPEDDPPPENQAAPEASRGGEGGNNKARVNLPKTLLTRFAPHRQHLLEQAESYFHIDGAHHVDHPDRRPKTRRELIDGCEFGGLADRAVCPQASAESYRPDRQKAGISTLT